MAVFDLRIWSASLLMWACILGVVRKFSMLEILVLIVVVGGLALFAAVKFTAKPTNLDGDMWS